MEKDSPTAVDIRRAMASGELTWHQVVADSRARIAKTDGAVSAFVAVVGDAIDPPVGDPTNLDTYPLFGLPWAVKDVIDTASLPTSYGSPIYEKHQPVSDAACASRIRETGGLILGKSATTEFATRKPCATRNPSNLAHTPGGSSSGSAAAVAAGMIPLALGTQTLGSVIRPAAYCGVYALKPTFGMINRAGVKLLSESVDTVGVFARSIEDLALGTGAIAGRPSLVKLAFALGAQTRPMRLAFCRSPQWPRADPPAQAHFSGIAEALRGETTAIELPHILDDLEQAIDAITEFEIWDGLGFERTRCSDLCSAPLKQLFAKGGGRDAMAYEKALRVAERARQRFDDAFDEFDCLVTLSAPGEAPRGLDDTGPPIFNKIWNLLHVPCVTVPFGHGDHGLPLGLQVIAPRHRDEVAIRGAAHLERLLRNVRVAA